MNLNGNRYNVQSYKNKDVINVCFLYDNQPSSISKRELPFLGPVRTGEGARD